MSSPPTVVENKASRWSEPATCWVGTNRRARRYALVVLRELGNDPVDILFYTMLVVGVAFIAAATWTLSGS